MASGFKTSKRYRLTFVNENTFNAVWTVKLSRLRVWALSLLTVAAIAALVLWFILATPLSALLPGYMLPSQRAENVNNTLRVDSLTEVVARQTAYLENVGSILSGTVNADSVAAAVEATAAAVSSTDTLLSASPAERRFVEQWTARERYNLSVLTPLAADAITFHAPLTGVAEVTDAAPAAHAPVKPATFRGQRGATAVAVARGTVTDVYFSDSDGSFTVMVQHGGNFLSRTQGLVRVYVEPGDKVGGGDALGQLSDSGLVTLQLWHNGTAVYPPELIQ